MIEGLKKYYGWLIFAGTVIGSIIGVYNDAHVVVIDWARDTVHEEDEVKPRLELLLPHADSILAYKAGFRKLKSDVEVLKKSNRHIHFQATQAMKQIFYYVMIYDPVTDTHGCKYHVRRFPDDGTSQAIAKRDFWKIVDDVIYLVEMSNEGAYYTDINEHRVNLPHRWQENGTGSSGDHHEEIHH